MDGSLINYPIRLARAAGIPEVGYQPVTGPKTIWTEMCPCQHERNPSTGPLIISERSNTRSLFGSSVPLERDNHSPTCWFVVWYYRATGWTWPPRVRWEHVNQLELKAVHQNYNRFLLSWAHPWWTCPMSSHCRRGSPWQSQTTHKDRMTCCIPFRLYWWFFPCCTTNSTTRPKSLFGGP